MSSRFQRWILPGLAFKAAVIGGGYATGRELAEYFIPSGPQGGVAAILVFVGLKMVLSEWVHPPITVSLGVILGILTLAVTLSLLKARRNDPSRRTAEPPSP